MMTSEVDYGVRVIVAYQFLRVGQIIKPNGVERDKLVRAGFCERVLPPAEEKPPMLHLKPKNPPAA